MKLKHQFKGYALVVSIIILIILLQSYFPIIRQFASPEFVREYLRSLGPWGYFMYVLIFLLSIPLPIPSTPVAIAGGYIYGMVFGTILSMIGTLLGASISFFLVRKYGEPLLEKMVSRKHIKHFNHIFKRRGINGAIIAYAIPIFPSDSLDFILGLSDIRFHTFLFITLMGNIPRYLLTNALGDGLFTGFSAKTIVVPLLTAIYLLIVIFREKVKLLLFKDLKELENDAQVIGRDVKKEVKWLEEDAQVIEQDVKREVALVGDKVRMKKKKVKKSKKKIKNPNRSRAAGDSIS